MMRCWRQTALRARRLVFRGPDLPHDVIGRHSTGCRRDANDAQHIGRSRRRQAPTAFAVNVECRNCRKTGLQHHHDPQSVQRQRCSSTTRIFTSWIEDPIPSRAGRSRSGTELRLDSSQRRHRGKIFSRRRSSDHVRSISESGRTARLALQERRGLPTPRQEESRSKFWNTPRHPGTKSARPASSPTPAQPATAR